MPGQLNGSTQIKKKLTSKDVLKNSRRKEWFFLFFFFFYTVNISDFIHDYMKWYLKVPGLLCGNCYIKGKCAHRPLSQSSNIHIQ